MGSALPVQEPSMDDILASIRRIIEGREDRADTGSQPGRDKGSEDENRSAGAVQPAAKAANAAPSMQADGAGAEAPVTARSSGKPVSLTASNDEGKTPFAGATQTADAERIASKVEELATLSVARMRAASLENAVRDYRETEMAADLQAEEAAMDTQFEHLGGSVPSFYDEFDEAAFASELLANAGLTESETKDEVSESARLHERRSRPAFEPFKAPAEQASMRAADAEQSSGEHLQAEAAPLATVAVLGLARPATPDVEELAPSSSLSEAISILAAADEPEALSADEVQLEASAGETVSDEASPAKGVAGSAHLRRGEEAQGQPTAPDMPVEGEEQTAGIFSLVSSEVEGRISSSFDQLAEAVRADQLARMDDTVRDMLRPMLSDWLEDNLPSIVERMVREEIERVARGPRRA
ncbi:Cell pole-organizing protein PopZ [Fulvimarina manganoxydans]|uniref:Cell pole-organizing protein PopZ n=2 Tax=Fulvimarina manganoxydans TaxID=937218 RepID=A0A1W2AKL8_9HYPH|nr:Cell pole-organizing protein PopZ [Fulvimarina manganoxydans]